MTLKEKIQAYIEGLVEQDKTLKLINTTNAYVYKLQKTNAPEEQMVSANVYLTDLKEKSNALTSSLMVQFEDFYSTLKTMSAEDLMSLRFTLETELNHKKAIFFKLEKYGLTDELKELQLYIAKTNIITSHITNLIFNKQVNVSEPKLAL